MAKEAVKKSLNEQKHIAQRRKGAEAEKKTKQLFNPNLCASASLREIVYFFTASKPWGNGKVGILYEPRQGRHNRAGQGMNLMSPLRGSHAPLDRDPTAYAVGHTMSPLPRLRRGPQ
jgi:hypothetical protein